MIARDETPHGGPHVTDAGRVRHQALPSAEIEQRSLSVLIVDPEVLMSAMLCVLPLRSTIIVQTVLSHVQAVGIRADARRGNAGARRKGKLTQTHSRVTVETEAHKQRHHTQDVPPPRASSPPPSARRAPSPCRRTALTSRSAPLLVSIPAPWIAPCHCTARCLGSRTEDSSLLVHCATLFAGTWTRGCQVRHDSRHAEDAC